MPLVYHEALRLFGGIMRFLKKGQKTMEPQTVETPQKNSTIYVGNKQKRGEMPRNQLARQRLLSSGSKGIRRGGDPTRLEVAASAVSCYLAAPYPLDYHQFNR